MLSGQKNKTNTEKETFLGQFSGKLAGPRTGLKVKSSLENYCTRPFKKIMITAGSRPLHDIGQLHKIYKVTIYCLSTVYRYIER